MRTITTHTTVYKFEELSDEAKAIVLERERDALQAYDNTRLLTDYMQEQLEELLTKAGASNLKVNIRYSLGYCQGDGASFTGEFDYKAWHVSVDTNHWGTHYQHHRSVDVKEMNSLKTDKDAPDTKWAAMQTLVESIGQSLEKLGYAYIEEQTSDETIEESLIENGYEFTAEGNIA